MHPLILSVLLAAQVQCPGGICPAAPAVVATDARAQAAANVAAARAQLDTALQAMAATEQSVLVQQPATIYQPSQPYQYQYPYTPYLRSYPYASPYRYLYSPSYRYAPWRYPSARPAAK